MSFLKTAYILLASPWGPRAALLRRQRRQKRRSRLLALLGGKCSICGSKKNLQFDHLDPLTKMLTISKRIDLADINLMDEVKKCQLLCRKCHHKKTLEHNQYNPFIRKNK